MSQINTREKKMILIAVLVILCGVFYKYVGDPYWQRWNSTNSRIVDLKAKIIHAKKLQSSTGGDLFSQNTIQNQTATIATLLENLEQWSSEAGVTITSIKPGAVQSKGTVSEFNFDVEVNGELAATCKLINSIEDMDANVRINKIRISKPRALVKDLTTVITVSTLGLPDVVTVKKAAPSKETDEKL